MAINMKQQKGCDKKKTIKQGQWTGDNIRWNSPLQLLQLSLVVISKPLLHPQG